MAQSETSSGTSRRRRSAVLRALGFAVAIVLGGVAIWLIATSDTVKSQRVGALAGMWGALVGAYAVFGARRHEAPADPGTALELRQNAALARSEDVASQREFQARLEALLRREVQEGVSRELAGLRSEVSALRKEILENVGGQLRMERTETTRLFGSNLEALQREVNQLKGRQIGDTGTIDAIAVPAYRSDAPAPKPVDVRPRRVDVKSEPVDAEVEAEPAEPGSSGGFPPFRPLEPMRPFGPRSEAPAAARADTPRAEAPRATAPRGEAPPAAVARPQQEKPAAEPPAASPSPAAATLRPTPVTPSAPTPAFVPSQERPPASSPAPAPAPGSSTAAGQRTEPAEAASRPSDDLFEAMPRITPFTDFELDAAERASSVPPRGDEAVAASQARLGGRHATAPVPPRGSAGGRRRRTDDSENDVLAQILAREKPHEDE